MPWAESHFRLFISHVSKVHKKASELAEVLRERYAIHGFVAHVDIEPSKVWEKEIRTSLQTMDALVAILTPGFSDSHWCNQEVGWALGRGKRCLAISIRLGEDPVGFVARFQSVPGGDGNPIHIAKKVFVTLAKHEKTAERIGVTTSAFLRRAHSWEQIRDYISPALDQVTKFSDEALDHLAAAFEEREHVRSSYHLGKIEKLLRDSGIREDDE